MLHALLSKATTSNESPPSTTVSCLRSFLIFLLLVYLAIFCILLFSTRAQCYLVYLHWIKPPEFLFPLSNLTPYRLSSSARVISQKNLRGWHLLPPGPPFVDGTESHFDHMLSAPGQRVIIFFHGNSGTRACPSKRVDIIRLLAANFQAHVVTFDYSGFADSSGRPSEQQFYEDARQVLAWVKTRVSHDSDIIIYGQSLGTFAAVDLAAHVSDTTPSNAHVCITAVILDAAPASLIDAGMTHPSVKLFRVLPFMRDILKMVVKEKLNSAKKVGRIRSPLLIMHGEKDNMVTFEQGQMLYQCAVDSGHPNVEFQGFKDAGHTDLNASSDFLQILYTFLEKHIQNKLFIRPTEGWGMM